MATKRIRRTASQAKSDRASAIRAAHERGTSEDELCRLTGLSRKQVRRILQSPVQSTPIQLTPTELRACRREHAKSPEALRWLATQRTDRRHNGHPMERSYEEDFGAIDAESN